MIIVVALFRDLLLKEIRSQRTWGCRATGGYIILSSRGHSLSRIGMKEVFPLCFLHSSTGDVGGVRPS